MRLLVIGGTIFLGRHCVEAALRRGHEVTLFHRGRHGSELFPEAEHVLGDRDGGLETLDGREWDAVLDTCGYVPRVVAQSAQRLASRCEIYAFISSISAYADLSSEGVTEEAPLATLENPLEETVTGETYGALKAACERVVEQCYAKRCLVVRPGLIVGPWDPTDRFTYWPVRISVGGNVLAPGDPARPVQFVDVRDLAEWIVAMLERRESGVFNAVGPNPPTTFGDLLDACVRASGSAARLVWVPDGFLLQCGAEPWADLPLWLPARSEHAGMECVDGMRAWNAGLKTRPIIETVRDTLCWYDRERRGTGLLAGMNRDREQEILSRWHRAIGALP